METLNRRISVTKKRLYNYNLKNHDMIKSVA